MSYGKFYEMVHVRTKEIYSKLGLSQSLNGPNQRFKWVMGLDRLKKRTVWGGSQFKEEKIRDGRAEEVEEFLGRTKHVSLRKVTVTILGKNWRKLLGKVTITSTLNALHQSCTLLGMTILPCPAWLTPLHFAPQKWWGGDGARF